jgi:hypothetical protein
VSPELAQAPRRDRLAYAVASDAAAACLWLPWERRGDLLAALREVRARHPDAPRRITWRRVRRRTLAFHQETLEALTRGRVELHVAVPAAPGDPAALIEGLLARVGGPGPALPAGGAARARSRPVDRPAGRRHRLRLDDALVDVIAPPGFRPPSRLRRRASPALQLAALVRDAVAEAVAGPVRGKARRRLAERILCLVRIWPVV